MKMRKAYILALSALILVPAIFIGCGTKEEEEKSVRDLCSDLCEATVECGDYYGSGSPGDMREECRSDCAEATDEAKDIGCGSEVKKYLECFVDDFECDDELGSGELICEEELRAYARCFDSSSGSGS